MQAAQRRELAHRKIFERLHTRSEPDHGRAPGTMTSADEKSKIPSISARAALLVLISPMQALPTCTNRLTDALRLAAGLQPAEGTTSQLCEVVPLFGLRELLHYV